ncbi:hypothetical protein IT418_01145 [bacterium]|nr:hypothetical protein [bacterium]
MFGNFYVSAETTINGISNPLGENSLSIWGVVNNGLTVVLPLAGIIFVGMFVYAGITYILSSGDPGRVKSAQAMMTNAVIGFLIISFAFVIKALVVTGISGGTQ